MGDFHGKLRERRRLLSLFVFSSPRLRPNRAGGHLRARLPPNGRGPDVRSPAAAEEDQEDEVGAELVQVVIKSLAIDNRYIQHGLRTVELIYNNSMDSKKMK